MRGHLVFMFLHVALIKIWLVHFLGPCVAAWLHECRPVMCVFIRPTFTAYYLCVTCAERSRYCQVALYFVRVCSRQKNWKILIKIDVTWWACVLWLTLNVVRFRQHVTCDLLRGKIDGTAPICAPLWKTVLLYFVCVIF